jgi:hypothetical protein
MLNQTQKETKMRILDDEDISLIPFRRHSPVIYSLPKKEAAKKRTTSAGNTTLPVTSTTM